MRLRKLEWLCDMLVNDNGYDVRFDYLIYIHIFMVYCNVSLVVCYMMHLGAYVNIVAHQL